MLTLGLFLLVINALMIMLVAWLVPGFLVAGFWSAVFAAIVVSLTSWVMSGWIGPRGRVEVMTIQPAGRAWALVSASAGSPELPEFEGRHSEAALEPHFGAPFLIHARGLEDGRHRVARRKRDSGRIGFRACQERRARPARER